jgi:hypothetical protein
MAPITWAAPIENVGATTLLELPSSLSRRWFCVSGKSLWEVHESSAPNHRDGLVVNIVAAESSRFLRSRYSLIPCPQQMFATRDMPPIWHEFRTRFRTASVKPS